jgi:hypothetical protein
MTPSVDKDMKQTRLKNLLVLLLIALTSCQASATRQSMRSDPAQASAGSRNSVSDNKSVAQNPGKLIHVIVALCDNEFQGIVPVPPSLGNGDDPPTNLYWGAGYGVKSFFRKSKDWTLISEVKNPTPVILERCIFKLKGQEIYMVADAYRGREIKQSTIDFLDYAAGRRSEPVATSMNSKPLTLNAGGSADLIAYVGHDGLMDFALAQYPQKADDRPRDAVILACVSKSYFNRPLRRTGANPLLWTTGLMAPEAYVLKAAVDGWILKESGEKIRTRAAQAYHKYQKCGLKAAMNLFSNGW